MVETGRLGEARRGPSRKAPPLRGSNVVSVLPLGGGEEEKVGGGGGGKAH